MRAFVLTLCVACSSSSGVKGDAVVAQLSPADYARYCEWFNAQVASVAGKSCGEGSLAPSITLDCAKNPAQATQCKATVEQAERCANKLKDNLCQGTRAALATAECKDVGQSCAALFASSGL